MSKKISLRQPIVPFVIHALMALAIGSPVPALYAEPASAVPVQPHDAVRYGPTGNTDPSRCKGDDCEITVVEYTDLECSYCEKGHANAEKILKDYQGRIRWIVRDFPLPGHPRAKRAAVAAQCARDQGRYWEMHDAIFKNQHALAEPDLKKLAESIGLNAQTFASCMNQPEGHEQAIEASVRSGKKLNVTGTPTYFINGQRVTGALPYEKFKSLVDKSSRASN